MAIDFLPKGDNEWAWNCRILQQSIYVIGSGGSRKVYKVVLGNGQLVDVKKLGWGEVKDDALHDHGYKIEVQLWIEQLFTYSLSYLICTKHSCANWNNLWCQMQYKWSN